MENKEKYNGWTNYATWRIKLEMFDDAGRYTDSAVTAEQLKDEAEESLFCNIKEPSLVADYARAFLADVNWHEIATSINTDNEFDDGNEDSPAYCDNPSCLKHNCDGDHGDEKSPAHSKELKGGSKKRWNSQ